MVTGAFLAGAVVGGVKLGAGLAVLWLLLDQVQGLRPGTAFALLALAIASAISPRVWRLAPQRRQQVSYSTLSSPRDELLGVFRWGAVLGIGVKTNLVTPAAYGIGALALLTGPYDALAAGCVYGLARGAAVVVGSNTVGRRLVLGTDGREPLLGLSKATTLPLLVVIAITSIALALRGWGT